MASTKRSERAARYHARISANVDDLHAGRIDHETFHERSRGLWAAIRRAGYDAAVMASIRVALYGRA